MEYLIQQMFLWFQVTEERLCVEKEIPTPVDTLRWDYYQYVREHPVCDWSIPASILYGGKELIGMAYRQVGVMGLMERAEKQKKVICKCFWKQIT